VLFLTLNRQCQSTEGCYQNAIVFVAGWWAHGGGVTDVATCIIMARATVARLDVWRSGGHVAQCVGHDVETVGAQTDDQASALCVVTALRRTLHRHYTSPSPPTPPPAPSAAAAAAAAATDVAVEAK